ncbi:MAG: hypothetical protein AB1634_00345 [Thermodesulfobacteriota bacterium]
MVEEQLAAWAHGLVAPLGRLLISVAAGLLVANVIEAANWTHGVARLATPFIRFGRLSETTGASFSLAFFSSIAANSLLAEAHDQGRLSRRELVLANLLNSLPTYFLHLPTLFFVALPLLGRTAFIYVGLTLLAAGLRTAGVVLAGRLLLPAGPDLCLACQLAGEPSRSWREIGRRSWQRFRQRIGRVLVWTIPIYSAFFALQRLGFFAWLEGQMGRAVSGSSFLQPEAVGIVIFHLAAEIGASLAAAGALLQGAALPERQVVLALLVGNILSSPMRALRHQLPYYSGIFSPALAGRLVLYGQVFRAASIVLVALGYGLVTT